MTQTPAVEMRGIVKRFPGVLANDNVDLTVMPGEIHGIVGENGAGKSTLMNILAGVLSPDAGTVKVFGELKKFRSAAEAIHAGIGMVHQHFMLVPSFTVLDNLILGSEPTGPLGLLRRREAEARIREFAAAHGFRIDPHAVVRTLPVAVQQQVEILKCLLQDSRIMIFDEPTSVLAPQEAEALLKTLQDLARSGRTILFISHKLREVMAVCDRITVLRDGRVTGTVRARETSVDELARLMVGREIRMPKRERTISLAAAPGEPGPEGAATTDRPVPAESPPSPVLEVRGLTTPRGTARGRAARRQRASVGPIDLTVAPGEIVGVAAISGNGQAELVEALGGLRPVTGGVIRIAGRDVTHLDPHARRQAGLAYIPQDRRGRGTAPSRSVLHNAMALHYRGDRLQRRGWLKMKEAARLAQEIVDGFDVRTPGVDAPALTLSGGNLQKLVVGRELSTGPKLLIAEDPTQGVDIGSVEAIRRRLLDAARQGCGILLVSQDLTEVIEMSDRIIVLYEGRVVGETVPGPGVEHEIGLMMTGATAS